MPNFRRLFSNFGQSDHTDALVDLEWSPVRAHLYIIYVYWGLSQLLLYLMVLVFLNVIYFMDYMINVTKVSISVEMIILNWLNLIDSLSHITNSKNDSLIWLIINSQKLWKLALNYTVHFSRGWV